MLGVEAAIGSAGERIVRAAVEIGGAIGAQTTAIAATAFVVVAIRAAFERRILWLALQPAGAAFVATFAGALAGAASGGSAALVVLDVGAALTRLALEAGERRATDIGLLGIAEAFAGAAFALAARVRDRAAAVPAGEVVGAAQAGAITANVSLIARVGVAAWAISLPVTFHRAAFSAIAAEVPGWTAVAVAITEAIAAGSAVATDIRRRAAIAAAITEPTRAALAAVADLIAMQTMAIAADAGVLIVIIRREGAWHAGTALGIETNARSRLLGAADLSLGVAAVHADVILAADLAGILAIAFVAASVLDRQIDAGILFGATVAAGRIARATEVFALACARTEILDRAAIVDAAGAAGAHRGATAIDQTALIAVQAAFRPVDRIADPVGRRQSAGPAIGPAAQLLAVAGAIATGVVATFTVGGGARGHAAVTAGRADPRVALRESGGADAFGAIPGLVPWASGHGRRRGWPPGCLRRPLQQGAPYGSRAPETKQSLQHAAPTGAARKRLHQRIETTIIHPEPP
jgi:hypothetical protein